jgi:type VI secretion system protein ImpC
MLMRLLNNKEIVMAIQEHGATGKETTETISSTAYERLCDLVNIEPVTSDLEIGSFTDSSQMADIPFRDRVTAALQVFIDLTSKSSASISKIDKTLLDLFIAQIDEKIGRQLDAILHHEEFQKMESAWKGLKFLVERCDFRSNIKVDLLDVSKDDLRIDMEESPDTTQCGLYKHIYVDEYDTPGGEPVTSIVSNYEFDASAEDIALLSEVSRVSAAAHCPFIGSVGVQFFGKDTIDDLPKINDLSTYMERAEYIRWKGFRDSEDSRYVGLTLPRFLLRMPYGKEGTPVRTFNYEEDVSGNTHENYLWCNASFAFAANMARSFKDNGWVVNIRGPESGGKVDSLPIHLYDEGRGLESKIPTEILIPETRELEFANLGFIPLSYYKNSDFACFFSANSVQKPVEYTTAEATANSRINARLPYIYLVSRLAQYLKVLQRENIGSSKSRQVLENELNDWIQTLVTKMNDPDPELIATHPLRDGKVSVKEIEDNPGFYQVSLYVMPHFQIEGVDVRLSLVAQLPKSEK